MTADTCQLPLGKSLSFVDQKVAAVIRRLERQAKADNQVLGRVSSTLGMWDTRPDAAQLVSMTSVAEHALLPVSREVGCLLFQLAVSTGAKKIVEYGTSFGMSTLYLAAAARETGALVIGTEMSEQKAVSAATNLKEAGLCEYVEILVGDARQTLATVEGPVGLVLLDGWVPLYLSIFQLLEPRLQPGSLVVSDTVSAHADKLCDFYAYLDSKPTEYLRTSLPLDDGVDLVLRIR